MARIFKAAAVDAETVLDITRRTIRAVYPHYYPAGAVDFFLNHHSIGKICRDTDNGNVWLITADDGVCAGTVTVNDNEINRLFVLPEYQGNGLGRMLLDHAESIIAENYDAITLSASLPAKMIYQKRGYSEEGYFIIDTDGGDKLCYDMMTKKLKIRK